MRGAADAPAPRSRRLTEVEVPTRVVGARPFVGGAPNVEGRRLFAAAAMTAAAAPTIERRQHFSAAAMLASTAPPRSKGGDPLRQRQCSASSATHDRRTATLYGSGNVPRRRRPTIERRRPFTAATMPASAAHHDRRAAALYGIGNARVDGAPNVEGRQLFTASTIPASATLP